MRRWEFLDAFASRISHCTRRAQVEPAWTLAAQGIEHFGICVGVLRNLVCVRMHGMACVWVWLFDWSVRHKWLHACLFMCVSVSLMFTS